MSLLQAVAEYEAARARDVAAVATDDRQELRRRLVAADRHLCRLLAGLTSTEGLGYHQDESTGLRYAFNPASRQLIRWRYVGAHKSRKGKTLKTKEATP